MSPIAITESLTPIAVNHDAPAIATIAAVDVKSAPALEVRPAQQSRYVYLDCLRGFAALWVVVYHLYWTGQSTQTEVGNIPTDATLGYVLRFLLLQYGYIGVQVFFVISGFCIHLPQARESRHGGVSFGAVDFYWRRLVRLYPAYFATVLFASLVIGVPRKMSELFGSQPESWWDAFQLSKVLVNLSFTQLAWPEALSLNSPLWTLVYEMQFYLVYPVLLWLSRRVGYTALLVALLAIECCLAYYPCLVQNLMFDRIGQWFLGVYAAQLTAGWGWRVSPARSWTAAGFGAAAFVFATLSPAAWPLREAFAAGAAFFALLALAARAASAPLSRTTTRLAASAVNCLAFLGSISYSLYLTHLRTVWFTGFCFATVARKQLMPPGAADACNAVVDPIAVLCVAIASFALFERPFLRSGKAPGPPPKRLPLKEEGPVGGDSFPAKHGVATHKQSFAG